MFISRANTPAVLPLWMVLMTRCPVSPACTAMLAVSGSRISPTMMTCGSCRINERSALRIGKFLRQVDLRLGDHRQAEFHRVFHRGDADGRPVLLHQHVQRRINRRRLARTRSDPVNNINPLGFNNSFTNSFKISSSKPSEARSKLRLLGSKIRTTIFSPRVVGKMEMRCSTPPSSGSAGA